MAGATKAEILGACGIAIAMTGGPAMTYVPRVLRYLDEVSAKRESRELRCGEIVV